MKKTEIKCDYCGKDLSTTSKCIDWSLRVQNINIPCSTSSVTLMDIHPPLPMDLDFCGIGCLKKYFNDK